MQSTKKKHVVSRPFHRSYLEANKISKSEGIKKVEYVYHFRKCAGAVYQKLSKLVHACPHYSLPKLARFWRHSVVVVVVVVVVAAAAAAAAV